MLKDKGYEVDINPKDKVLSKKELIKSLKNETIRRCSLSFDRQN